MDTRTFNDVAAWAQAQWGQAALGDTRRQARAVRLGAAMATLPAGSLPKQTQGWGDLKAAYRLLNEPEVTHAALSTPHWEQTRSAAAGAAPVLFIQDTTEVDFSAHKQTSGLGPIGNGGGRGFEVQSCLAVRPTMPAPTVLGLAYQRPWVRGAPHRGRETRRQRWQRDRESAIWGQTLAAIGTPPPGATWVSVSDRGSDGYGYVRQARDLGWHCVLRLCHDRLVPARDGQSAHLRRWARALPAQAEQALVLRTRPGQPRRTVRLRLAWAPLALGPACKGPERQGTPVAGWCLRCWGEELEWLLFSTLPIPDAATAQRYAQWYGLRSLIEEYHKCLKTGCRLEARQLTTGHGLLALLGLLGIVAVRLLHLRMLSRQTPDQPAAAVVPDVLLTVLSAQLRLPRQTLTLHQFYRGVARMGGFLGRASDGDPGWQTLWLGWQRLQDLTTGYQLAHPP
jgi:hypothetical protein